jgi:hypothetical protein
VRNINSSQGPANPPLGKVVMGYKDRRLAPRHSFVADIEMTDVQSGVQIRGRVKDLSLLGCGVNTSKPFPKGTRVRIKLSHGGADVAALAKVAYARPELGMGVVFTSVEPEGERILGAWIEELMSIAIAHA